MASDQGSNTTAQSLDTTDPAIKALGQHIIAHVLESGEPDDHSDHDIEWKRNQWSIRDILTEGDELVVVATQSTSQSKRVSRATYTQPAEYKNYDVELTLIARVDWTDNSLGGKCHATIQQQGGVPSPPDPEPQWRDI